MSLQQKLYGLVYICRIIQYKKKQQNHDFYKYNTFGTTW